EEGEKEEHIGILSPVIFSENKRDIWFSGGKVSWLKMRSKHEQGIKKKDVYETEYVTGCAMLIKARVFKEVGLFDEDFFLYWEDADFCLRAKKEHFKNTVVSAGWVYHAEKSEKKNKNKIYWLVLSGLIFFRKNTPFFLRPW